MMFGFSWGTKQVVLAEYDVIIWYSPAESDHSNPKCWAGKM